MNTQAGPTKREGLRFFGRVSASVSHEIKNVLAVINEGAGLMEDLSLLAEKGLPVEPGRLREVARSILGQVRRGDDIVKNMNLFAHSVDEEVGQVDLAEALRLTLALCGRFAALKNVSLALGDCAPASVRTDPYALEHLLHQLIRSALERTEAGATLTLACGPTAGGALITLAGAGWGGKSGIPDSLERLARPIKAGLDPGGPGKDFELRLPGSMAGQGSGED
ncbi:MAG: HAMP domain-containing histidine kinase [Desulfovibrionaceae bacterium]|nr:HAMP domain-containing histidine kinase [Desulfovibrionaceae bacterium]